MGSSIVVVSNAPKPEKIRRRIRILPNDAPTEHVPRANSPEPYEGAYDDYRKEREFIPWNPQKD